MAQYYYPVMAQEYCPVMAQEYYPVYPVIAQDYYYRPLASTRSTRVLLLQPDADHNAELRCILEEISLDMTQIRRYSALSYVWGAKAGTRPLYSEGMTILITPNCEKALRHLRHVKEPVTLWVDAICINQKDLNERAQQVSLMGDVYRNADEVVIWLGEGTKETARCFSRTRTLSRILSGRIFQACARLHLPLRRKVFSFLTGGMPIVDLFSIYHNEWATRIWTVQELILASKPAVMCGHSRIPWKVFFGFASSTPTFITHTDPLPIARVRVGLDPISFRDACTRFFRFLVDKSLSSKEIAALIALITTLSRGNECSDPLDKVYAIYPLITHIVQGLPIVDYSKDRNELYESFTLATIRSSQKFWPALHPLWTNKPASGLPSWVPEMSSRTDSLRWRPIGLEFGETNATLGSLVNLKLLQYSKPGTIALKGKAFAEIVAKDSKWPELGDLLSKHMQALVSWIDFSLSPEVSSRPYYRDGGPFSALREILVWRLSGAEARKARKDFIFMMEWISRCGDQLTIQKPLDDRWLSFFMRNDPVSFLQEICEGLSESILIQTTTGQLGVAYGFIRLGDTIALLAGSDVPVVLRKEAENWHYLGPAYVYGISNGEAWPQDANTDEMDTFVLI